MKKTNKKLIYLFLILSTMAIQSQDINNKWAINIGFVGIKYYGDSDSNRGFVSAKQFPRISISRYTSKNITLSGAFSTSPNKTNKYTTFDGEIRYDFGTSENIVSLYALIGGSIVESKTVDPTLNFGAGGTLWITDSWGLNSQLMYKYIINQTPHIYCFGGIVYRFSNRRTSFQKKSTWSRKRLWN